MHHLLAFSESTAAAASDDQINAVADPEFTTRNNRFIFTEPYNMIGIFGNGASMTRARLNVPEINAIARHQIWPVERSATIPDEPGWQDYRDYPMQMPVNEEVSVESTNDLAMGTEIHNFFIWLAPPSWNRNLPRGIRRLTIRVTGAVAGVAQAWSALGNLTFAENLRGGWYSIIGAQCFDAGTLALRFVFAKPFIHMGRKLRPGIICQEAIGNTPLREQFGGLGVFGHFHSFEPPQIEILANATAASTQEIRLDLVWHGERMPG